MSIIHSQCSLAASWIALEDVHSNAGELFYHVGSHKMPEFHYNSKFKGAEEAKRADKGCDLSADYPRHIELIRLQAQGMGLPKEHFLAKRGDVLIWSADLAHGGGIISGSQTRKSVVTHYCPFELVPQYFEKKIGQRLHVHGEQSYFTSSHYNALSPV